MLARRWTPSSFAPFLLAVIALGPGSGPAAAQNFVAVTDTTNPIVTAQVSGSYTGCAWIDADGDNLLDLFIVGKAPIYRNLGGGVFTKVVGAVSAQGSLVTGTSWSDYDNDGDIDCYVVGGPFTSTRGAMLYRNEGNLTFTKILDGGDIGDIPGNTGWGCAWADIDNDAWTDLVIAAANGFGGVTHENRLLYNNGDATFTRIDSTAITDTLDAYTIPTWSDYDMDGDVDLFIGSGEVSQLSPDNHFRNMLTENGSWGFERITTAPIATDSLDGQVWNWIDYDNDGDLDAFQTNYNAGLSNNLYRNDAGTYVKMSAGDVGAIASSSAAGLANLWGDFDNDGDVDCLVTNDGGQPNEFHVNNGDGTFTKDLATAVVQDPGPHYGAAAADHDRDGDLDLYVHGTTATKRLYRNDLSNGFAWLQVELVGAGAPNGSNVSALGARVRVKANIDGSPVWQIREVSAQDSFNSMSMLNVHFGLKNATVVDTLEISWPAGGVDVYTNVPINGLLELYEGVNPTSSPFGAVGSVGLRLHQNAPNPARPTTRIDFAIGHSGPVRLVVFDVSGRRVRTLVDSPLAAGAHRAAWDGRDERGAMAASGVYFYRLESDGRGSQTRRLVLRR